MRHHGLLSDPSAVLARQFKLKASAGNSARSRVFPGHRGKQVFGSLLFLILAGCASHLHNASNLSLAQKADGELVAITRSNATTFESMLTNLDTFSKVNAELYESLAQRQAQIQARQVKHLTWRDLQDSFASNGPLSKLQGRLNARTNAINAELKLLRGESREALKAAAESRNELDAAKAVVTSWNRKVAVLQELIETAPSLKDALKDTAAPKDFGGQIEAYTAKLNETLGQQQVTFLDADGNSKTNDLATELTDMLNLNVVSTDPDTGTKILEAVRRSFTANAPGLVVTTAGLAKDLAEAESARLSSRLDSLERRLTLLQDAAKVTEFGFKLATEGGAGIRDFPPATNVTLTLISLAKTNNADSDTIAGGLLALSHYITINSEIDAQVERALLDDAHEQHLQSIRTSEFNLRQQEAMAARGLESLVVYHGGGIKSQEISELAFKVVQLGLLSWIGLGVN
jgi:hypothetical protein